VRDYDGQKGSKDSSNPYKYFTEQLVGMFGNPTQECNENPKNSNL
jgi:hypothetical protein